MVWAFGRIILIAFSILFCLILVVFGLRFLGHQQVYGGFQHPLLDGSRWVIAKGGEVSVAAGSSSRALTSAYLNSKTHILGLQIRKTLDNDWVVFSGDRLEDLTTTGEGPIQRLTRAEIGALRYKASPEEKVLMLDEALAQFADARFYIDVVHPGIQTTDSLFEWIRKFKIEDRLILTSQFINTLKSIRTADSRWLTAASTADSSKARLMTSIFLEPMMELPGEVFIAKAFSPRLLNELVRRKKIVILETDDPSVITTFAEVPHFGVLTTRPTLFTTPAQEHSH